MTMRRTAAVLLASLCACATGMQHTRINASRAITRAAPALDKLGNVTAMQAVGDVLYVAGEMGLAAVKPDGAVAWALELPKVSWRSLAVEGERIAFSQYTTDERWFSSTLIKPSFSGCAVGLATTQGSLLWTTACEEGDAASPPALGADRVAVSHGARFGLYSVESGKRIAYVKVAMDIPVLTSGLLGQASLNRPVFADGGFYVGHLHKFAKVGPEGRIEFEERSFNVLIPFDNITAGPAPLKDLLVFAALPGERAEKAILFASDRSGDKVWTAKLGDSESGVGSLVAHGDRLYAATNTEVCAYDATGERLWRKAGGSALSPSALRGVLDPTGAQKRPQEVLNGSPFMSRRWNGSLMEATDARVYLASRLEKNRGDAITVLDANTGAYVETVDIGGSKVLDMALAWGKLAVSTERGLLFVPLD